MKRKLVIILFLLLYPIVGYYGISYIKHLYEEYEKSPRTKKVIGVIDWGKYKISYFDRWSYEIENDTLKISSMDQPNAYILYAIKQPSAKVDENPTPINVFEETYEHLGVNFEAVEVNEGLPFIPWELRTHTVKVGTPSDRFVVWKMSFYLDGSVILVYAQCPYSTSLHKKISRELLAIHDSFRTNE